MIINSGTEKTLFSCNLNFGKNPPTQKTKIFNTCHMPTDEKQNRVMVLVHCTSTGLLSAFGNVSGNRCQSDCRSRGREFDLGPVPYLIE